MFAPLSEVSALRLGRHCHPHVGFVDVTQVYQDLPDRPALPMLHFEGLAALRAIQLAHSDQNTPQRTTFVRTAVGITTTSRQGRGLSPRWRPVAGF